MPACRTTPDPMAVAVLAFLDSSDDGGEQTVQGRGERMRESDNCSNSDDGNGAASEMGESGGGSEKASKRRRGGSASEWSGSTSGASHNEGSGGSSSQSGSNHGDGSRNKHCFLSGSGGGQAAACPLDIELMVPQAVQQGWACVL